MDRFLKRIWDDIIHGENLDAYIIIAVALILSVWSLVSANPNDLLPGVTLAVLTLLTISALVGRHRLEDLREQISPSPISIFAADFPSSFAEDLEMAKELWLIGASHDDIVTNYYSIFERKLNQGHMMRVLVMNPHNEDVLKISEMRAYANPSVQRAREKIEASLGDFCTLRQVDSRLLSIRVINFPIAQRMIIINPTSRMGKVYIANYPFQTPGGQLPKFVVKARNTKWFTHFVSEAQNLWDAGQAWQCGTSTAAGS